MIRLLLGWNAQSAEKLSIAQTLILKLSINYTFSYLLDMKLLESGGLPFRKTDAN
jgi:hypothetical protein